MRLSAPIVLFAMVACEFPFSADPNRLGGHITFSSPTFQTSPSLRPPFVSVVDSIALVITPSGDPPLRLGQALTGRDTIASFPVELPEGTARVAATILSPNGTVLFAGDTTANVDREGFTIPVPLTAQGPVLVIAPDSARGPIPPMGQTSLRVYNRGLGSLGFTVFDTSAAFRAQCVPLRCYVISTRMGQVPAFGSLLVRIDSIRPFQVPIGITFSSDAGDVVFVLRTQ